MPGNASESKNANAFVAADEWSVCETKGARSIKDPRYWQFRISVLPAPANLRKAQEVLNQLINKHPIFFDQQKRHPTVKIITDLARDKVHMWDPVSHNRGGETDRDQRGKEICVYMTYDSKKGKHEFTPNDYKELMLSMWSALEAEGVELSYITPARDEAEVQCEAGILSPFCYSSFKPYDLREGIRHGILMAESSNPKDFEDPLRGVIITAKDLKRHAIKKSGNQALVSLKRIRYQEQHLQESKQGIVKDLVALVENKDEKNEYNSYGNVKKIAGELLRALDSERSEDAVKECIAFLQNKQWRDCFPRMADNAMTSFIGFDGALKIIDKSDQNDKTIKLKGILQEIISKESDVQQEIKKTAEEFNKLEPWIVRSIDSSFSAKTIQGKFEQNPLAMQLMYRRLCHMKNAEARLARETSRLDSLMKTRLEAYNKLWDNSRSVLENAKHLLIDYTKGFSRMTRIVTGHWNRHHVIIINDIVKDLEVKTIKDVQALENRLLAIPLVTNVVL